MIFKAMGIGQCPETWLLIPQQVPDEMLIQSSLTSYANRVTEET
jgi:hypothetical protein